jgi:hypothetical protein
MSFMAPDERTPERPPHIFHAILPATLGDPQLGPLLARLRDRDPEVLDAVADVDRSLIWAALKESPRVRVARSVGLAQLVGVARRAR